MPDRLATESLVDVVAASEPVRTLVREPAATVEPHDSLRAVARELVAGEADAALVVGPIGELGIVTPRDVVVVVAAGDAVDGETTSRPRHPRWEARGV